MENSLSPIFYVTVEQDMKTLDIQSFTDLQEALNLALSLHMLCQKKLNIQVHSDKDCILDLSHRGLYNFPKVEK